MTVARSDKFPKVRAWRRRPHLQVLVTGLFCLILAAFSIDCSPKVVRVVVPPQDMVRANEFANEGDLAFDRKDFYAALIKYLEAYRLNPNSEYLTNRLGIAYSQLRLFSEANQSFRRAIALNNKYSYAYNNIGSVYFTQQNYRKAEKYFKKAISLNANEASFHLNLGSLYLERKKRDKAMAEWRKSLALDPKIFSRRNVASLASSGSSMMERNLFFARILASAGNVEGVIESLKQAYDNGFTDVESINKDPEFDPIRKDERFVAFLQDLALLIKAKTAGH